MNTRMLFERFQNDLWKTDLNDQFVNFKTKYLFCGTKEEKRCSSFMGGSVVGCLSNFEEFSVNKSDYEEHGFSLIERKLN